MPLCFKFLRMSDGNTSFLRAARAGQLEKVLEHLKGNIDINTSNANGLNALHLASKDGHVEVVDELLKRGAVVDAATKKGNTALHIASLAGQEEVVRILVHHGASVNVQSQNGFTPLYMAAQENHDNVVKYLLANGANQSLATEDGFTPLAVAMQQGHDKVVTVLLENDTRGKVRLPALHIAAKKDDVKAAKLLLENEHNPDVTSKSGFTPLHIASHYGNEQIANLLIVKGADVNYAAKHNITPLHVAAKWGKSNMVMLLLEKGANIESKTRDGLTPLHCAARSGHEQVVDMLLDRGAPISCKTKNGLAPLHMAAQGDHVDAARILLYHRAPVDEVTVDYLTALHVAAHCGHVRVAKLLLDRQADANARALNGFTPLHIACKKNRIKVVELLLKHGASIGATTESGLTPLHVASFMGCMNIVIYLLQHDASPDAPTVRGETPLHLAARANQTDIIRILLRNGAQVDARAREQQTPLHIASRLGNVDIVMLLLQHGAKVDTTTKDMYTALHIAAKEGQDEVAAVLIEHGASLNATTKKGFTPLHLAAKYGNMKVAKLLLQKEAPVDAQGKNGVTPLHVASHYDHQNVALLLLDKGASPHATAKNGHTPLHIAARKNQMDIANTLLEYGAKPNAESKAGFTPLHLSAQEGHTDMTALLIEHKANTNQPAKNGLTPLHLCAQEDRVPVAEILVKNGAEVDTATKGGFTPLHIASHYGQANMVRFLLANGADVTAVTSLGYTPLHQAAQQGHTNIVNLLLENSAQPNAVTNNGQTPLNIAQKLGYISVIETLKIVTETTTTTTTTTTIEEKYKVVAPEAMQETFMSDSEEEGGEDTVLGDHSYRYLTADEMKSLGDDSLPIDVTRDERIDSNRMVTSDDQNMLPPQAIEDGFSPQYITENYVEYTKKYVADNVDIARHPINIGFLVSFLVDARGGAMRGCRHSGVRVIVPPRCAPSPTRITCRYVRPQRTPHPPPLMEGEALASRVLELGPVGAKFLGPVIIEVPHFAALRGKEREIVILRSDNGETWREHTVDSSEEILNEVLTDSFEAEDLSQLEDVASGRITRILTHDFPQYFAIVTRIRQEVHAIGPEGGMVSSTVVPQVQAVFPQGALTKKIKVGLQAQPIDPELSAKLLGHGVAVSPVVTVEPRRRKFHKAITLSMPAPRAHSQGMINQYSGNAPTLRLLCSITGGTTRAQWEDVTGSTPLTFVNDCVSFTTTVSARFWLMDCRNIGDATKMATELYREAIHVPFMAKFVVFAKRIDPLEARLRVFCMTDDKEDKTLEHQEHFTEVAKSRDVEVLEGKPQYIEFAGNLVPITKSGEPLQFSFRAFRENRLPFSVRVKDQHAEALGRCLFMREPKVAKGEPPQQPICILNIVLPDDIVTETHSLTDLDAKRPMFEYYRPDPRLADMSNLLGEDWVPLATQLGLTPSEINVIKSEYPDSVAKQAQSMLRMWISQSGNKAQGDALENALRRIGREDIIPQCLNVDDVVPRYRKKDIESVMEQAPRRKETYESKYSAEEKDVNEQPSDEEDFNKTVSERREEIQKRLTEMIIPASQQRQEIVEEITSIKRQSMVEDKIAEVEIKQKPEVTKPEYTKPEYTKPEYTKPEYVKPEVTKASVTKTVTEGGPGTKTVIETVETVKTTEKPSDYQPTEVTVTKQFMEDDTPDRKTTVRTIITETRTIEHFPTNEIADKTDSELLECVSQRLESRRTAPRISTTEVDPYSPKLSKTPPPSPADFIFREQQASMQGWSATDGKSKDKSSPTLIEEDDVQEVGDVPLTKSRTAEPTNTTTTTETIPKPKPRSTKSPDTQLTTSLEKPEIVSPIKDEFLEEEDDEQQQQQPPSSPPGTYSDKKKFWETITKDGQPEPTIKKRMSLYEESSTEKISLVKKRTSIHEVSMEPPVPRPRAALPSAQSISETKEEPEEETKFPATSEYKSSFIDPSLRPSPKPEERRQEEERDSDSDQEDTSSVNHSAGYENTGYISDSGDVEHYISDSEIEDRVPQLRDRQMSVFHPPSGAKKNMYERSMSLPTEDLYDLSAKNAALRKQYYEEKIRQEMVEEQLMTELEEEASPERKTLSFASEDEPCSSRTSEERTIPESSSVKDIARTFGETVTPSIPSIHKEPIGKQPEKQESERKSVRDLAKGFETESGSIVMGQKMIPHKAATKLIEETTKYIEESIDDSTTDFTMHDFETSEELGSKELDEFSRKPLETLDLHDIQESSKLSLTTFDSELQLKVRSDIKGEADILGDDMSELEKSEESKITYASEIEKDSLVMRDVQKPEVSEEQPSLKKIKEQELESDLSEVDQKSDASRITYASDIEKDTYKEEPVSSMEEVDSKEETSILEYDKCNGKVDVLERRLEETKTVTETVSHVQQSSTESEQSVFSDTGVTNFKDQDQTSKPSDSMEVHVDKSEIEDSEKLTDFEQDATDIETKSLDSLNATEMSPKSSFYTEESIPEITISLSGKQRRISEESDEYESKPKAKSDKHVNQPEEHIQDTVWEVSVESQAQEFDERVEEFIEKEVHKDQSETSQVKSQSHNEIEKMILESLHQQQISEEDAIVIASELLADIEAEIHRRHSSPDVTEAGVSDLSQNDVSEYLKQLAETKGLDSREVQLVQSVLARKQRQLSKLTRGDTGASSMEITDEDLRYSGGEIDSRRNILEEQIEHLEVERSVERKLSRELGLITISDHFKTDKAEDSPSESESKSFDDVKFTEHKTEKDTKVTEKYQSDKQRSESFSKDEEGVTRGEVSEIEMTDIQAKVSTKESEFVKADAYQATKTEATDIEEDTKNICGVTIMISESVVDDTSKSELKIKEEEKELSKITGTYSAEEKIIDGATEQDIKTAKMVEEQSKSEIEAVVDKKEEITITDDVEQKTSETSTHKKISSSTVVIDSSHTESKTTTKFTENILPEDMPDLLKEKVESVTTITEIKRTSSEDSKSDDIKSPEEPTSTSSSGKKSSSDKEKIPDVILRKAKKDGDTSSGSPIFRPDRKSGIDFEAYSSSGESHYQSFELDSGRSRPCSSDVEGLIAAGSSEYESALTEQDVSAQTHMTSYHTAVSSLSSKESMKSLDSESSGNLASVEVSEASETLVASECDPADMTGHAVDDFSVDRAHLSKRQSTELSDSELVFPDNQESIDVSEEDVLDKDAEDVPSKMKRSAEMTFQPEPKVLVPGSPHLEPNQEMDEKFGTSVDEGSVLSMSLSSTSSATALRTVIEQAQDRLESSLSTSVASDQFMEETFQHMGTSTHSQEHDSAPVDSVTITTSTIDENGISSVSTQVTSRGPEDAKPKEEPFDPKKRGHRRCESTVTSNIISSMSTEADRKVQSDLAESDKYTSLSLKEGKSDEKKDVDETEKDDYDDTEADQGFHRDLREGRYTDTEYELDIDSKENDVFDLSRPHSQVSLKSDSERERIASTAYSDSELADLAKMPSEPSSDPIERPHAPEPCEEIKDDTPEFSSEAQASIGELEQEYTSAVARSEEILDIKKQILMEVATDKHHKEIFDKRDSQTGKLSSTSSEKSSFEEAEAEAAFSMVAHISPAHKIKQICPILEDEDAEKHELETRERAQKEYERRRLLQRDLSPGSIPDIKVTQHMAPLIDRGFHYPDLELEEQEEAAPKQPSTSSEKESKTCTTVLEETEEPEDMVPEEVTKVSEKPVQIVYKPSPQGTASAQGAASARDAGPVLSQPQAQEEPPSPTDSPNSDSFEMLEKPDLIDDFVVIEEVAKEAHEMDTEGKSVSITSKKYVKKTDKEIEEYLVKSAPSPSTKMTDIKYYPDGSSSDELGFDFEESPPQPGEDKSAGSSGKSPRDYVYEYDRELEANKKWIEQQFQGNQAAMIAAGYGYEMEFERGPLEDIKEEDLNDLESRIGSLSSQKESGGSLGSVKDSYSSTPEYDVLAGRKYFTRSGEHDDVSMSSLQEFENLERAMSLENRRCIAGSQDSSSNGSYKNRIYPGRSGQGDDVSVSSLKEFEGLEKACIAAHKIDVKVKEEEAMLTQIDEGQESLASESESCETISGTDKKLIPDSDDEDYERRMFEIDEIIKQAQTNVERFIEVEKTESLGRGDSFEEVAKVPDLDLDAPLARGAEKAQWTPPEDIMLVSTDSLDLKPEKLSHHDSTDSLDQKVITDVMTASTDSIEFQTQKSGRDNIMSDSLEIKDKSYMITSDSLEMVAGARSCVMTSDSIDEDGSRIGGFDQSSSSTGKDFSSSVKDDEFVDVRPQHFMLESTDSIASTSTATHATYQYETDSVLSGLKCVDVAAAVKKVWFDDDTAGSSRMYSTEYVEEGSKPYVTEVIEPCEDDGYSHTIHRRVEMPAQVTKVTFTGSDADEQLRQFIENFGEGEDVQESEEVDKDGNVHVKRVVQKRFVIKSDDQEPEGVMKRTCTDEKGSKTIYTQQFDLHHQQETAHSVSVATGERSTAESSDVPTTRPEQPQPQPQTSTGTKPEADEHSQRTQESEQERSIPDQHMLSDEMRRLLKELEDESKK